MKGEHARSRHSIRRGGKLLAIVTLILTCALCSGCLKPPSANNAESNDGATLKSAPYPADYYEGYWICSGYERDGQEVSFNSLSPEERDSYPFLVLDLEARGGTLAQVNGPDGEYRALFGGDSQATSEGIRLINEEGGLDLTLVGESLALLPEDAASLEAFLDKLGLYLDSSLPQGEATYYFDKLISGSQLWVDTYEFDGISLDVPSDIVYTLDARSPATDENGKAYVTGVSYRRYGPMMDFSSMPTDAENIAEVIAEAAGRDYAIEHADQFTEYEGCLYYLDHDEELSYSRLSFVAGGKIYEIVFDYEDEDVVDYSEYCEYFFTSIRFAGDEPTASRSEGVSSWAIPWQEAAQHVGETVTVYGPVAEIEYASESNGQPTFIDLGVAYPDGNRVTLVIWGEERGNFPERPEVMYAGKTLSVTGEVYMHEGVCNIQVTSPSQVQVL